MKYIQTYTSRYMWVILVLSAEGSPMLPTFCPCNERQIWASSTVHHSALWELRLPQLLRVEGRILLLSRTVIQERYIYIYYIYIIHKSIYLLLYICIFMFILHVCVYILPTMPLKEWHVSVCLLTAQQDESVKASPTTTMSICVDTPCQRYSCGP